MSLFLGNLSPHIRREDLEWVFRRFGPSNVQLKYGYGFVIYDVPGNAERALRALRGKKICGEQISLTWANKQPRPFQRFSRTTRFNKPYRGRDFREESNGLRNRGSHDQRDFITRQSSNYRRGPQLADALDKEAYYTCEEIDDLREDKDPNAKEGFLNEGYTAELNTVGNDRWGDSVSNSLGGIGVENENDFEQYEPCHGFEQRDDDENHHIPSPSAAAQRSSAEKGQREHSPKSHQMCFICGLVGHKMSNCPHGDAPRQDKFSRFNGRRDDEMSVGVGGEGGLKRTRTTSSVRPHAGRDPSISRHHAGNRKGYHSGKRRRLVMRKRSRRECETPKKHHTKRRVRRSASSSLHSDSTATNSRSHSPSSRSVSGISSRSRSKSVSPRSHSESSSARYASVSSYSKSANSRSRSRSRSSLHKSPSLSISLDPKSQSSSKNVHMDSADNMSPKDDLGLVSRPESKHHPVENLGNSEMKDASKYNEATSFKVDDNISREHLVYGDLRYFSADDIGNKEIDSCMDQQESVSSENLGKKTHVGWQTRNSLRISPPEMRVVLKHCGLACPEESEPGLPVDVYFGASRLWPWEMIYYRRLKKGPISIENYARRVEQNKEFGIVDKYIRSSSGWKECDRTDI